MNAVVPQSAEECEAMMLACLEYLDRNAEMVSNLRKPRTDNTYGMAAQKLADSLELFTSMGSFTLDKVDEMAKAL